MHTTNAEESSPMQPSLDRPSTTRVALQVIATESTAALRTALRTARRGLSDALDTFGQRTGQPRGALSEPVPAPGGPMLLVAGLGPDDPSPRALARQLAERLNAAGIADAEVVALPDLGRLDQLLRTPNAALLRIFPDPDGRIAASWLTLALAWVESSSPGPLTMRVADIDFDTDRAAATGALGECLRTHTPCELVRGDPASWVKVAALAFEPFPHLVLAGAGGDGGTPRLLRAVEELRVAVTDLPRGAAYACIDLEVDLRGLTAGFTDQSWRVNGSAPPNGVAAWLVDEFAPGVFPYQVLGPRHQAHLGGKINNTELLSGGRVGLQLGEPGAWLPTASTRPWQQAAGRERLDACLLSQAQFDLRLQERTEAGTLRGRPASRDDAARGSNGLGDGLFIGEPDLDRIELTAGPQRSRGTQLSFLELVSWLGGQTHSDEPSGVSPCAATFIRRWSADLDPANRQRLVGRAPALLNSAGDDEVESERRWAVAEWLAYDLGPTWLRLAGSRHLADTLDQLGPLDDETELIQAVTLLGQAIVAADAGAARAIDRAVAGIRPDLQRGAANFLTQAAAGAWQGVLGPTGWVAAATAATHDVPAAMIGKTRQQLALRAGDPVLQHQIAVDPNTLAERAWTAALHAVGDEVWHRGWSALDSVGATLTNLDVSGARAALAARSTDGQLGRATAVAQRAAREVLVRAALFGAGDERRQAWDAALDHARSVPGSEAWCAVTDAVRAGVGEWTWDAAMDAARTAIVDPLRILPRQVGRTTLVAVAAEAAAASARAVAAEAAGVAMTAGASPEVVHRSAYEAIAPTAATLTASALTLFDQLIGLVVVDEAGVVRAVDPAALVH